jgi:hypothetical protein
MITGKFNVKRARDLGKHEIIRDVIFFADPKTKFVVIFSARTRKLITYYKAGLLKFTKLLKTRTMQ